MSAGGLFRDLATRDSYGAQLGAVGIATLLGCAPWLLPVLGIAALLALLSGAPAGGAELQVLIVYAFACSLILVAAIQSFGVRYLWDRFYADDPGAVMPAYAALAAPVVAVEVALATAGSLSLDLPELARACWVGLFAVLSAVWLAVFFLTALKDHLATAACLGAGVLASLAGAWLARPTGGLAEHLGAVALGYSVALGALLWRMVSQCGWPRSFDWRVWSYLPRLLTLFAAVLAYALGIWMDKIMFWAHPDTGTPVVGWLRISPAYDNAQFLATMTIVPALGMLLMRLDTDFGDRYREFFQRIVHHCPLDEILAARDRLAKAFWTDLGTVLRVQAILAACIALLAAPAFTALGLSWSSLFAFRFGVVAMVFQLVHLAGLLALMYFDCRPQALLLGCVYLALQAGATWLTISAGGLAWYGVGSLLANGVAAMLAVVLVSGAMQRLEHLVFAREMAS